MRWSETVDLNGYPFLPCLPPPHLGLPAPTTADSVGVPLVAVQFGAVVDYLHHALEPILVGGGPPPPAPPHHL